MKWFYFLHPQENDQKRAMGKSNFIELYIFCDESFTWKSLITLHISYYQEYFVRIQFDKYVHFYGKVSNIQQNYIGFDAFILNPLIWFWQLRTTNQRSRAPIPAGASTHPLFGIIWPLGEARVWRSRWDDGMIWTLGEVKVWRSRWGEGMTKIAKKV